VHIPSFSVVKPYRNIVATAEEVCLRHNYFPTRNSFLYSTVFNVSRMTYIGLRLEPRNLSQSSSFIKKFNLILMYVHICTYNIYINLHSTPSQPVLILGHCDVWPATYVFPMQRMSV
jgi:hypothetical protein